MNKANYQTHQDEIKELISEFQSSDGLVRQRARMALVNCGWEAVRALVEALSDANEHARWEAAEALGAIADPSAAVALVHALEDESMDVRGAAAESLINLDRGAVLPLLQELTQHFDSVWLRSGAHHVLHVLKDRGRLTEEEIEVFNALENLAPEAAVPWAAVRALETLRLKKRK